MKHALGCLLLLVACALAWAPVRRNGFINYDDNKYVTENPVVQGGLTREGLRWAFDNHQTANFHPLTWLSHMLDVELFGLEPAGHHVMSVGLHTAAACALWFALLSLGLSFLPALGIALLFAVHPLRVESVAWVAERKDVLSGLFFALMLWSWALWTRRGGVVLYLACLACLVLGLGAKSMLVTAPFVLLLLDRWPLDRKQLGARRLILEKLPHFAVVAVFSWIALSMQRSAGAVRSQAAIDVGARIANAFQAVGFYLWKSFVPTDLAVFYPHPAIVSPGEAAWSAAALAGLGATLAVSLVAVALVRRRPSLFVGWAWFLGMLVPVIGLVQIGEQAYADRYAYLPTIGLYLALIPWLAELVALQNRAVRGLSVVGFATLVVFACLRTRDQVRLWYGSETVFTHALQVTERNHVAHFCLGSKLLQSGYYPNARDHLTEATNIQPDYVNAHYNLGIVLQERGFVEGAIQRWERVVELQPDHVDAHVNLGLALGQEQQFEPAMAHFERALALDPNHPRAHASLGSVALRSGKKELAEKMLRRALELDPSSTAAHVELGRLLEGRAEPYPALEHYKLALQSDPGSQVAARSFAWLAATVPVDPEQRRNALAMAQELVRATGGQDPELLDVLAANQAVNGDHAAACETQQRAIDAAQEVNPAREYYLGRYRQGQSLVQPGAQPGAQQKQ